MKSRIEIVQGQHPVLLVVPHGVDDVNTAIIGEKIASKCDCYAVINQAFRRDDEVDVENDIADCNRIDHVTGDEVVYEEFLKPILKIRDKVIATNNPLTILHIHGCGNHVDKQALNGYPISFIVGYGVGTKKASHSTIMWKKNFLRTTWNNNKGSYGYAYEGSGGGNFAGRNANNLNQYFVKHNRDKNVDSMQIEIPYKNRQQPDLDVFICHFSELVEFLILSLNDKSINYQFQSDSYLNLSI